MSQRGLLCGKAGIRASEYVDRLAQPREPQTGKTQDGFHFSKVSNDKQKREARPHCGEGGAPHVHI